MALAQNKYIKIIGILFLLSLVGIAIFILLTQKKDTKPVNVTNFEECAKVSGQILESYPEQCIYNGQNFTRQLTEEEKKSLQPPTNQ